MTERKSNPGFEDIDQSPDPKHYVQLLDSITALEGARQYKQQTYELLQLGQGSRVLDVGSGNGDDVLAMAKIVGQSGLAVGIDSSGTMISEARGRVKSSGVSAQFVQGDAHRLDFDDGNFDGCRIDRVLHHVESPIDVLKEVHRVTRPGGRVVAFDPDFESMLIDGPDQFMTRKVLNFTTDVIRKQGWMGRQLARLFKESGFVEISVTPFTGFFTSLEETIQIFLLDEGLQGLLASNLVSDNEAAQWMSELRTLDESGKFFSSMTSFLVSGTRPA